MSISDALSNQRPEKTLAGSWQLDGRRSSIEFRVPYLWGLGTVIGHFDSYRGRLDLSASPKVELTIDATSVRTGNSGRDRHLRSPAFFDAEDHPQIRFAADSAILSGDTLMVRGQLCARDRSIALELDATLEPVDGELAIAAAIQAPHRELGMTFSPLGVIAPCSELRVQGYLVPRAA